MEGVAEPLNMVRESKVLDSLGHLFAETLASDPQRLAVVDTGSDGTTRSLTYAQLDLQLNRMANAALALGLEGGDRVGVALGNSLEFVIATFGLMRAGVVPALFNPRLSTDDLAFMINDAGAKMVLTDTLSAPAYDAIDQVNSALQRVHVGDGTDYMCFSNLLEEASEAAPAFVASDEDIALQIYTSGSTGRPKGVRLPHRSQIRHFQDQRSFYGQIYTKPPVNLIAAPMFHKNGTGMMKTVFATGGTAVIMPRFDARAFLENIAAHEVTTFTAVAAMLNMMLAHDDLLEAGDFSRLDAIMVGASPSGRVLLDKVAGIFGTRLFHMFGTTESGAVMGHDPAREYTLDSCGKPLPGVEVKLIDPETGDEADQGELFVAGPGLALGYHNRPEVQAERFRDGWYATGDILSRDDEGFYFFRGRVDDMFVCGGENVYPREVERQLLDHPQIAQAFVGPIPHPIKGQAPAAVILSRGDRPDPAQIKQWYLDRSPAFSLPRLIIFRDEFPLAPTGKVDGKVLEAELLAEAQKEAQI
ncbi:class I adenylate-forming enzyme family protein [Aurantiacibacter sediminis]|uniref:Acyl--CoA ligase n=1 Tax=Aurantiacibacter sediminis TaxID=2793064 RepID=A0ABS0N6T7_9SPHN|nr:class I adenylate-forming enzyme family protein [Aurantiacibacter sediminis]MBH5323472.1 acyl--CoA ligase [Aurantiacibacter sediminis]